MRKWKKLFSLMLVFLLPIIACTVRADAADETVMDHADDIAKQISMISSKLDDLIQPDGQNTWYYSVMDFDHNGRVEFFAATQHPADRSTNLRVWEVTEGKNDLSECSVLLDPEESFPDIVTNAADTYYDRLSDTWSSIFYDNIVFSPADVMTVKCSVSLKDGTIAYESYATEHSELVNSYRYVSHLDSNGIAISEKQYNDAGTNAFAGAERSSTNFDWFPAEALSDLSRLADSYAVFAGQKEPVGDYVITEPSIFLHDELQPVWGEEGDPNAVYMMITRNPTSETVKDGGTVKFVADANIYDSAYWTFVSPDGGEYDLDYFQAHFVYSPVSGAYDTVLTIREIDGYMDGWGAYCTFYFKGQTACTSTAWLDIRSR